MSYKIIQYPSGYRFNTAHVERRSLEPQCNHVDHKGYLHVKLGYEQECLHICDGCGYTSRRVLFPELWQLKGIT